MKFQTPLRSPADIFRWMAEEENRHIEWFEKLKQDALAPPAGSLLEQNQSAALGSILGKQKFSLDAMDVGRIENTDELIAKLIEFEYDTVLFYEMIKTAVSSTDAANLLDEIIAEEKQHIRKLKEYKDEKRLS